MSQQPVFPQVLIQRQSDEREFGPYSVYEAAGLVAQGTFGRGDDARLTTERRWTKLGELLDAYVPQVGARIGISGMAGHSGAANSGHDPVIASLLRLTVPQLYRFFLKAWVAWMLVALTFAPLIWLGMNLLLFLLFGDQLEAQQRSLEKLRRALPK